MKRLVAAGLLALASCANLHPASRAPKADIVVCLSENLRSGLDAWQGELERRWPGEELVLLSTHGGSILGVWTYQGDDKVVRSIDSKVIELKAAYPGRRIVLLVCNPDGIELKQKGVWYAKKSVWLEPNRNCPIRRAKQAQGQWLDPDSWGVGAAEEFVQGGLPLVR